jgi:hypothetical protein
MPPIKDVGVGEIMTFPTQSEDEHGISQPRPDRDCC